MHLTRNRQSLSRSPVACRCTSLCTIVPGIVLKAHKHADMQQLHRRAFAVVRCALKQGKTQPARLSFVTVTPQLRIGVRGSFFFIYLHFFIISFFFIFSFSLFSIFSFFSCFPRRVPPRTHPGLPKNIAFYNENLDFMARIWVREERKKKEERIRKKNAPTETGPLPQSHAQDLFVIRVCGNLSLRLLY